jgi:hypothetical protein
MPYVAPRRAVSTATTITVNSNATALRTAAAATSSGTFNEFIQTTFWTRYPHPLAGSYPAGNFYDCNVGEDGAISSNHTHIDYGGKWCYYPGNGTAGTRKAAFMANGANPVGSTIPIYSWQWNTLAVYDEASNTWSTQRGITAPDEVNPECIVHILHNNTIDTNTGILYKKKFRGDENIYRYNLLTSTMLTTARRPTATEPTSYGHDGGLEFIPTRGSSGALWCFHADRNNNTPMISEYGQHRHNCRRQVVS